MSFKSALSLTAANLPHLVLKSKYISTVLVFSVATFNQRERFKSYLMNRSTVENGSCVTCCTVPSSVSTQNMRREPFYGLDRGRTIRGMQRRSAFSYITIPDMMCEPFHCLHTLAKTV